MRIGGGAGSYRGGLVETCFWMLADDLRDWWIATFNPLGLVWVRSLSRPNYFLGEIFWRRYCGFNQSRDNFYDFVGNE